MEEEYVYLFESGTPKMYTATSISEFDNIGFSPFDRFEIAFIQSKDMYEADSRLRKAIEKKKGKILPLPISNGYLEAILYKMRCGAKMKIISGGLSNNQILLENLPKIKQRVGRDFELRIKQSKRLKNLFTIISRFETTGDKNLLNNICEELYHLGIFID